MPDDLTFDYLYGQLLLSSAATDSAIWDNCVGRRVSGGRGHMAAMHRLGQLLLADPERYGPRTTEHAQHCALELWQVAA